MVVTNMKRSLLLVIFLISLPLNAQWIGRGIIVRKIMAPPKLAVSDDFNRSSLGSNWTTLPGFSDGQTLTLYGKYRYNTAVYRGWAASRWNQNVFSNDHYSEALAVQQMYGGGAIAVRVSTSIPMTGYIYFPGVLYKYKNGVQIWYTSYFTNPGSVIVRLEAVGNTISLYKLSSHGGVKTLLFQVVDSTDPLTDGVPAVMHSGRAGYLSDWYGGDL